jgi:5-methyltetrahydropteroyltriglutamate--homocysteine methyltransferase
MSTDYRAEHVGSLLRPPQLLAAREAHAAGRITAETLRAEEDKAGLRNIGLQRDAGITVFTDGEVRRGTFMAGLMESLGGVVPVSDPQNEVRWYRDGGPEPTAAETEFEAVAANAKLYRKNPLTGTEAAFLKEHAPGAFKITMMSASMGASLWQPGLTDQAYNSPEEMLADVVRLQIEEISDLIDQGVTWIQLDSLSYNWVIDPELSEAFTAATGIPPAVMLDMTVGIDAQIVNAAKAKAPHVTMSLHFCRGNNRSAWMARGSYEPVAERLFSEVAVDRFLLEFDTERAGGFEPLRFIPHGKTVALGLVSTKTPALESVDELRKRIDQAAAYVPEESLALTLQCGFASTASGNLLTMDDQRRKLELVAQTAQKTWG